MDLREYQNMHARYTICIYVSAPNENRGYINATETVCTGRSIIITLGATRTAWSIVSS